MGEQTKLEREREEKEKQEWVERQEKYFDELPDEVKKLSYYIDIRGVKTLKMCFIEGDTPEADIVKAKFQLLKDMYNAGVFGEPKKRI